MTMTENESRVAAISLLWGLALGMTFATIFWAITWWLS